MSRNVLNLHSISVEDSDCERWLWHLFYNETWNLSQTHTIPSTLIVPFILLFATCHYICFYRIFRFHLNKEIALILTRFVCWTVWKWAEGALNEPFLYTLSSFSREWKKDVSNNFVCLFSMFLILLPSKNKKSAIAAIATRNTPKLNFTIVCAFFFFLLF